MLVCQSSPCINGACTSSVGGGYECACSSGYTGVSCESDINECASAPCENGGTCTDSEGAYACACVAGFTGSACDANTDECASSPCQNSATCVDEINQFSCTCAAGYEGAVCATNTNECSSAPCASGASCVDGVNGFTCDCVDGTHGTLCTQKGYVVPVGGRVISPTTSALSLLFTTSNVPAGTVVNIQTFSAASLSIPPVPATLVIVTSVFELVISASVTGDVTVTIAVTANPGVSGLRMYYSPGAGQPYTVVASVLGRRRTTCPSGSICGGVPGSGYIFVGAVDECASSPCLNGGTCVDGDTQFTCTCDATHTGELCESQVTVGIAGNTAVSSGLIAVYVIVPLVLLALFIVLLLLHRSRRNKTRAKFGRDGSIGYNLAEQRSGSLASVTSQVFDEPTIELGMLDNRPAFDRVIDTVGGSSTALSFNRQSARPVSIQGFDLEPSIA